MSESGVNKDICKRVVAHLRRIQELQRDMYWEAEHAIDALCGPRYLTDMPREQREKILEKQAEKAAKEGLYSQESEEDT